MKFKERTLGKVIEKAVKTFPSIFIIGPRQSGKTTLLKKHFGKTHKFVSLEDPDVRVRAREDPRLFLTYNKPPTIIDEIQYVPELLSYIKTEIDNNRKAGYWLFTGSQSFVLMDKVSQSLAGRTAVLRLFPLSLSEKYDNGWKARDPKSWLKYSNIKEICRKKGVSLEENILRGFYPEISLNKKVDRKLWCGSFITTYIERDIRNVLNIGDLNQLERFLISCAVRTGQILNISEIARDIGISITTAKRWLSLLEAGGLLYLLYPYYRNIGKRIIKSPKIYFTDTGILSYLLGIDNYKSLFNSYLFGNLFETMVICDVLKRFLHYGEKPNMYYLRSRDGMELDLIIEINGKLDLIEIKAAETINPKSLISLKKLLDFFGKNVEKAIVISCSKDNFFIKEGIANFGWENILLL